MQPLCRLADQLGKPRLMFIWMSSSAAEKVNLGSNLSTDGVQPAMDGVADSVMMPQAASTLACARDSMS